VNAVPSTHPARGWFRSGGAILIVFLAAGCGAAEDSSPTISASASAHGSAGAGSGGPPSSVPVTPAAMLAAALAPLQAASDFETTVTVDGAVAVSSAGRSVGGSTQLTVATSGKAVDYVQVPPQAWARQSGASWVLVAVDEAPASPLGVLSAPLTLGLDPSGAATLVATYPAAALGLAGDPVTVTITLGAAVTFRYEADASGHPTTSETIIRPPVSQDPIVAPI
jgi:hypothetical protein